MANWKDPQVFAIWLVVIFAIFAILSAFIILFIRTYLKRIYKEKEKASFLKIQYQKELVRDSILIQESERERIAADLHDSLIAKLNSLKFLSYRFPSSDLSNDITCNIEDSIRLTRNISHDLCPPLIEESSLVDLFDRLLSPFMNDFKVKIYIVGDEFDDISKDSKLQITRIAQELMNNVVKHSEAKNIYVQLHFGLKYFAFSICDDGIGYDSNVKSSGLGAKNIVLRSEFLKAKFKMKSKISKGSSFVLVNERINL